MLDDRRSACGSLRPSRSRFWTPGPRLPHLRSVSDLGTLGPHGCRSPLPTDGTQSVSLRFAGGGKTGQGRRCLTCSGWVEPLPGRRHKSGGNVCASRRSLRECLWGLQCMGETSTGPRVRSPARSIGSLEDDGAGEREPLHFTPESTFTPLALTPVHSHTHTYPPHTHANYCYYLGSLGGRHLTVSEDPTGAASTPSSADRVAVCKGRRRPHFASDHPPTLHKEILT